MSGERGNGAATGGTTLRALFHEQRGVLAAILSHAELLEDGFAGPLDSEGREIAGTILRSAIRLGELSAEIQKRFQGEGARPGGAV